MFHNLEIMVSFCSTKKQFYSEIHDIWNLKSEVKKDYNRENKKFFWKKYFWPKHY